MNTQETETAVVEFLARCNVSFSVALVDATKRDDCTGHREDTAMTRMARANLKGVSRNSIAWHDMLKGMKPKAPSAASVLHSLVLDGSAIDQSFIDWCDEFDSDPDSRKAFR
jgi:hypothetical protein